MFLGAVMFSITLPSMVYFYDIVEGVVVKESRPGVTDIIVLDNIGFYTLIVAAFSLGQVRARWRAHAWRSPVPSSAYEGVAPPLVCFPFAASRRFPALRSGGGSTEAAHAGLTCLAWRSLPSVRPCTAWPLTRSVAPRASRHAGPNLRRRTWAGC